MGQKQIELDDILAIEHLLGDDEKSVRDSMRQWIRQRFLPEITEAHRAGTFPMHLMKELGELGVFGPSIQGYGCAGVINVTYG